MTSTAPAAPIRPAAAAAVTALVGVGLLAALWLLAYGGVLGARPGPGPASKAAEGLYGLTALLPQIGVQTLVVSGADAGPPDALLIIAPAPGAKSEAVKRSVRGRRALVILQKWSRDPHPRHPGWSGAGGLDLFSGPLLLAALAGPATRTFVQSSPTLDWRDDDGGPSTPPLAIAPILPLAVIAGPRLAPVLTDEMGRCVIARIEGTRTYLLADPDLLDNQGLSTLKGAAAAAQIIRHLAGAGPAVFVGAERPTAARSAVRLLFERPFGAASVCLCLAALLAAVQAFRRFGPAVPAERVFAFGKRALVDSAASLLEVAGREPRMAPRYLELAARRTAKALGVGAALEAIERDAVLERLAQRRGLAPLSVLAARAAALKTRRELLAWAIDLHRWSEEMVRGRP